VRHPCEACDDHAERHAAGQKDPFRAGINIEILLFHFSFFFISFHIFFSFFVSRHSRLLLGAFHIKVKRDLHIEMKYKKIL
jgi:hypothetical protein